VRGRTLDDRPRPTSRGLRPWVFPAAALVCVATLVPPVSHFATRDEWGVVLRYGLWAVAIPALVAIGAPWPSGAGAMASSLARSRARHPEHLRVVGFLLLDWLVMVWWFTPTAVRAISGNPWLTALEALTLIVAGTGFWLELVESPPLAPRSGTFSRAVFGALAMWQLWTVAYLVGMSQSGWYRNFRHVPGHGLSQAADQQVAAMVLWLIATAIFAPVIFMNAMRWLHSDPEPDAELRRLLKEDARGYAEPVEQRGAMMRREGAG